MLTEIRSPNSSFKFVLDYLKRSNIPNTAKRAKILKTYRKNPDIFKKKLATEMNRILGLIATDKSIKGNSTTAVDIMKIEVKVRFSNHQRNFKGCSASQFLAPTFMFLSIKKFENFSQDLEVKINSVNGLTNSIIENIRLKHNQVTQRFREQRFPANIVFADTCE